MKGILIGFVLGFASAMGVAHVNGLNEVPWKGHW